MSAEHRDDATFRFRRADDGVDDSAEVARREHVGKGVDERGERLMVARRMRELGGAHLVGSERHGNCANG